MQRVSDKWLWRFEIGLCIYHALLAGFLIFQIATASHTQPSTSHTETHQTQATETMDMSNNGTHTDSSEHSMHLAGEYGPIIVIGLSTSLVVYVLVFLRKNLKKSPDLPHIIVASVSGIIIAFATQIESSIHTWNHIAYILYALIAALAGVIPVIVTTLFAFTVLIVATFTHGDSGGNSTSHMLEMIYIVLGMFSGVAGWSFFRRYYTLPSSVNAISDMLTQEKFKSTVILESITDGVMVLNIKGTVQIMNQSAAQMLGWQREEALHLDYRSIISTETTQANNQPEKNAIDLCLQTQKAAHKLSLIITKNSRSYLDIVASPIYQTKKGETGEPQQICIGAIAVLRNVDEQKRQEEQRSDFISTASHEMRTPVAAIQGFIELALNSKVATIDAKARGYLEKAHEATKHLGTLFQDLLTVSKSDDGRLTNNPKLIEVGEFLAKTVEQSRLAAEKKNLKISLENNNQSDSKVIAPLLYVNVDPERLREVVLNLLDNAIKYTSAGIITVGTSLKETSVLIRVSDTGMGIPAEDIPHLFQKFYRTDNSVTREIGGTGLGLYICKSIVDMMSGKIWVESTVGAGSTFYVELPRISPEKIAAINMANNVKTPSV